jgi:hypothetical protein
MEIPNSADRDSTRPDNDSSSRQRNERLGVGPNTAPIKRVNLPTDIQDRKAVLIFRDRLISAREGSASCEIADNSAATRKGSMRDAVTVFRSSDPSAHEEAAAVLELRPIMAFPGA